MSRRCPEALLLVDEVYRESVYGEAPLPASFAGQPWLARLHAKETRVPYGIALAMGALMIYPETEWIKAVDLSHFVLR